MLNPPTNPLPAISFWKSCGLRTMTANSLARAGIDTIDALANVSENDLSRIYSLGKVGRAEIGALLLHQRQEHPAVPPMASFTDADLVMELLRRGYRIDRPNGTPPDA